MLELSDKTILLEEILAIDTELSEHDRRAGDFKVRHMATVNGTPAFIVPKDAISGDVKQEIESAWQRLCAEREAIVTRKNKALERYARL